MKLEGRWATLATVVLTVLRLALGTLFIISAYYKLQSPDEFLAAVEKFDFVPGVLAGPFATALPWAELCVGWCLVLGIFPTFAAVISILMTLSFVVANIYSLFVDVGEFCSCLGDLVNMTHGVSLTVDIIMLCVAGLLVYQRRRAGIASIGSLLRWERLRLPRIAILAFGAIVVIAAMLATFALLPEEKAPWKADLDSALKDDQVVVFLLWKGETSGISDELGMFMELRERYGGSVCFTHENAEEWDDAARRFDVTEFPTMLIIEGKNSKGYIVYPQRFVDAEDRDALVAAIDEVLAGS